MRPLVISTSLYDQLIRNLIILIKQQIDCEWKTYHHNPTKRSSYVASFVKVSCTLVTRRITLATHPLECFNQSFFLDVTSDHLQKPCCKNEDDRPLLALGHLKLPNSDYWQQKHDEVEYDVQ